MKLQSMFVCIVFLAFLVLPVSAADIESLHIFYAHEYENGIDAGTYWFGAEIQGSGISNADIEHESEEFLYELEGYGNSFVHYSDEYGSEAALFADYPNGGWNFCWGPNGGDYTLQTNNASPSGIASFTSIDTSLNPTFEWSFSTSYGTALTANIFDVETDELIYTEQWTDISYAPNQWSPGVLEAGSTYELVVGIWNVNVSFADDGCGDNFMTLSSYGLLNTTEFTVVPEPATITLFVLGTLALIRKR